MISIVTPSIPERAGMLAELLESVAAQTIPPAAHYVSVDWQHDEQLRQRNRLVGLVRTEWFSPVDDDDLLLPHFVETMYAATGDADVVYGYADMGSWPETAPHHDTINQPFDKAELQSCNYIPGGCALIRTDAFRAVGGYPTSGSNIQHFGDWYLWLALLEAGARFVCVPEITWQYRWHGANREAVHV